MTSCFEIYLLRTETRTTDGTTSRLDLETMSTETNEFLDRLLEPYKRNSSEVFLKLNMTFRELNFWPWAIIALQREYELAGHVCACRRGREDVKFTAYSVGAQDAQPMPVSMLFFRSKEVMSTLATRSPLFLSCWSALSDKPQDSNWEAVPTVVEGS